MSSQQLPPFGATEASVGSGPGSASASSASSPPLAGSDLSSVLEERIRGEWIGTVLALVHAIDHAWQALATHARLPLNELITLEHLYFCGPASSPALRRRTGLTASAVTGLIDRLEQRELVRRVRPSDDRRVVLVELTESGQPYAEGLFQPLLNLLELSNRVASPSVVEQQLATIARLADFFEHVARETTSVYDPTSLASETETGAL